MMFNADHRLLAARFIECALTGLRGAKLIECIRNKYPDATWQAMKRAAFLAVTRPDADERAIPLIYEAGLLLRAETKNDG